VLQQICWILQTRNMIQWNKPHTNRTKIKLTWTGIAHLGRKVYWTIAYRRIYSILISQDLRSQIDPKKNLNCKFDRKKPRIYYVKHLIKILTIYNSAHSTKNKRIGGVMVSVLASSVVDRGFKPRSGQTWGYTIDICCFSATHAALRRKEQRLVDSESE
jgi:hypothetical protein